MEKLLIVAVAFAMLEMILGDGPAYDLKQSYFVKNPKSIDYKFSGKKDEHRFGVELNENKQFHHTKTAEDGVRLGCYGHEQDGKMYSTHYVADAKGYRLVPHQGLITVYPKDGTEARKASFVDSFNEDEIRSSNIRYFFPNGCKSPVFEIDPSKQTPQTPQIQKQTETPVQDSRQGRNFVRPNQQPSTLSDARQGRNYVQSTETPLTSTNEQGPVPADVESGNQWNDDSALVQQPNDAEGPTQVYQEQTTLRPNSDYGPPRMDPITPVRPLNDQRTYKPRTNPVTNPELEPPSNISNEPFTPYKSLDNSKCSDTCCDDNRPQILMSRASPGSCCKGVSKLVIPIEMEILERCSLSEINDITSTTDTVEMLKKLLRFVEQHKM